MAKKLKKLKSNPAPSTPQEPPPRTIGNPLLDWHRALAKITGSLSLVYTRGRARRSDVVEWVRTLRLVADQMEEKIK